MRNKLKKRINILVIIITIALVIVGSFVTYMNIKYPNEKPYLIAPSE